jgi:O-antigen ligase
MDKTFFVLIVISGFILLVCLQMFIARQNKNESVKNRSTRLSAISLILLVIAFIGCFFDTVFTLLVLPAFILFFIANLIYRSVCSECGKPAKSMSQIKRLGTYCEQCESEIKYS